MGLGVAVGEGERLGFWVSFIGAGETGVAEQAESKLAKTNKIKDFDMVKIVVLKCIYDKSRKRR